MAKILHETLLLSCMAAFAIGFVLAAASVSAPGLRRGGSPGTHSPFLLVSREDVPWRMCWELGPPSLYKNARPARVVPGSEALV
jgi:hypothetical protein